MVFEFTLLTLSAKRTFLLSIHNVAVLSWLSHLLRMHRIIRPSWRVRPLLADLQFRLRNIWSLPLQWQINWALISWFFLILNVIYCWIFNSLSWWRRFFSSLTMLCVIHHWHILNWLFKSRGSLIRSLFFLIVNLFDVACSTVSFAFMWLTSISKSDVRLWVLIWIVGGWIVLHAFVMTNGVDLRWLSMNI